jgi:sugar lactone lactonase YvrE
MEQLLICIFMSSLCEALFFYGCNQSSPECSVGQKFNRRVVTSWVLAAGLATTLLAGCGSKSFENPTDAQLAGKVMGGQQPVTGATLQLYAVNTTTLGGASSALLGTATTSDGSGLANANANAANSNNTLPAGYFNITGLYSCSSLPNVNTPVYLTGVGGNPGLADGTNNTASVHMVALGPCSQLPNIPALTLDEVTTTGTIAAIAPYMTSYSAVGSAATAVDYLADAMSQANVYMNYVTGTTPGSALPPGYYASATEVNTLSDVTAACVNSTGGSAPNGTSDGSMCGNIFAVAAPSSSNVPTDVSAATLDILNNPTNNVNAIYGDISTTPPFLPALSSAPSTWALPITALAQTPVASPVAGMYAATQTVTLSEAVNGATIYYTTDGSTPTTSSTVYSGPLTVSASETVKAIASNKGGPSAAGSFGYTITGAPATPVISLASGMYSTPQVATLTTASLDASIYVTTDGTTPTASSTLAVGSVEIKASETLQAVAIAGGVSSAVASATYQYTPASGTIDTIAGGGAANGDGVLATIAETRGAHGVAVDAADNIYFSDFGNYRIRKVTAATGIITTIAGNGVQGFSGDGGPATAAEIGANAWGVAVDAAGNVFFADSGNNRIRKITAATGIITTFAGNNTITAIDNVQATASGLNAPRGLAFDASGNLYIADTSNNRIRKITVSTNVITTVAGTGTSSFTGDGGAATSATLKSPYGVAVDASGNVFIADTIDYRVRKVTAATGIITTVAGTGTPTYRSADEGAAATTAQIYPYGITVDVNDNLYIADFTNYRVREISAATGTIKTVAGNGTASSNDTHDGMAATSASLSTVYGTALDLNGNLYIADLSDRVREVNAATSIISTVAGSGVAGYALTTQVGDGGAATAGYLQSPQGVSVDAAGNVYIADTTRNRVRKVSPAGVITTIAGNGTAAFAGDGGPATSAELSSPTGVAVDASGNVYVSDTGNNRIRLITPGGIISTYAGTGTGVYNGDNVLASSTGLYAPRQIALDTAGNLYIADSENYRVRKVAASNQFITTVAGNGTSGTSTSGAQATNTSLKLPYGVALDSSGNLYIVDASQRQVFQVNTSGVLTLVAGNGTQANYSNGTVATSAPFSNPNNAAVDGSGNVYVADQGSFRIAKFAVGGTLGTVAGNGTSGFTGDGGAATSAELNNAQGIALDAQGRLYIADGGNGRIRVVYP